MSNFDMYIKNLPVVSDLFNMMGYADDYMLYCNITEANSNNEMPKK